MNFKAVFFDFDYTLADGTEAIVAGFRYAFGRMGLPEPTEEAIRPTIGMVLEDEFTFLSGEADPARRAEFRQLYTEKAGPMHVSVTRLFPGALELLTATNLRVLDIAMDCGFNSMSYFIEVFRTEHDATPLQYRKKLEEIKVPK